MVEELECGWQVILVMDNEYISFIRISVTSHFPFLCWVTCGPGCLELITLDQPKGDRLVPRLKPFVAVCKSEII